MWKALNPGDIVSPGDLIRHISSQAVSAFGGKAWKVVRTELHYFEIAPREETESIRPERRIIRYIDIGYHLALELWRGQFEVFFEE